MCQSSLINSFSFVFCEFNRVANWNEGKTMILVQSTFQIPKKKHWFHIQGQPMSMYTCLFLIIILKETLVLMCLASHFDIIEIWKLNVGHRDIYYAKKILNAFVCVEFRILVEKWNAYEGHIFPRPLLQIWRLEKTSFCLNTRLLVNKKFSNSLYFNWN